MSNDITQLINKANDEVLTAMELDECGDTAGAIERLERAMLAIAFVPDGKIEDAEVAWDRAAIDTALGNLKKRVARRAGVVTQLVRPTRG